MFGVTKDGAVFVAILVVFNIISQHSVISLGKRVFGESCSFGGHITSFFSQDREERTCNRDMGLICTGSYCTCPPGRVWDFNANDFGFADRSTRGCAGAAGSPCIGTSRNQQCVSNAHCQFAFCRCKPDFRQNGGHCVSTNLDSGSSGDSGQTRPANTAGGITFPELQEIFSGFNSDQNNHQLNNFNNNNNGNHFNDRFTLDSGNNYNDRFQASNEKYPNIPNDRFQLNTGDNHHNSRDGSKGSGRIRFE